MKQATEYVKFFRYKLRMMGIPVEDPTFIFGYNQSVLVNTTMPKSLVKKKAQSIAYQFVQEGCARDKWRTAYISTHENVSHMLTKPLPSGENRLEFLQMLLHHLAPQGVWWGDSNGRSECTVQGRTTLYLSGLKGISGEILLQSFFFFLTAKSVF